MMQVNARTEYGMRCLLLLAQQGNGRALSLTEIARREHLPRHYAEQILLRLRRAGLVKSIRGTQGGFALEKPPSEITLGAVIRVLEGIPFRDTCNHFNETVDCGHTLSCNLRPVWEFVSRRLWETLDHISLKHLMTDEQTVGQQLVVELPVLNFFKGTPSSAA